MKKYLIKKGNHYASMPIFEKIGAVSWKTKKHSVRFRFNNSCYWAPPRNNDDNDLNKLTGIGFGINHHNNSVRLAWVPDFYVAGSIKIYGYTYDKKKTGEKHTSLYITSVPVGQVHSAQIESRGNKYIITVNDSKVEMENSNPDPNICFRLFPYFGGTNTSPKDISIEIEYL